MYAPNEDPFDRRRLHLLADIIKKAWWVILGASLAVAVLVFVVLSFSESRYESEALVRGWRVAGTRAFVSPAELETRINSPDLLRKAKENYLAQAHQDNIGDLVRPVITVSWVPSSELLNFTATASSAEVAQGILVEALPILFQSEDYGGQAVMVARQRMAELESSMADLRSFAAKLLVEQKRGDDNPVVNMLLTQMRLASLRLVFTDLKSVENERASLAQTIYYPTSADIIQPPTLSDSPVPSRSAWVAFLAAVFVVFLGCAAAILVSAFSVLKQNEEGR